MTRFAVKLAYDGTNFQGWQSQRNGRTVQQEIERILLEIAKTKIKIIGSGRTDAGVHALMQFAHFDFPVKMTPLQIRKAMQVKSPPDIQILDILVTKPDFNARYDAYLRTYEYVISKERTPFNRFYKTWFKNKKIDPITIQNCLPHFIGEYDFTSFSRYNPQIKSTICQVSEFKIQFNNEDIILEISANRFLHNMVRRIVGCLVNISHVNEKPEIIRELIQAHSTQNKLITTAPPEGLYLKNILYPADSYFKT
jgi:tRNA pseudouridine38-40 synthase